MTAQGWKRRIEGTYMKKVYNGQKEAKQWVGWSVKKKNQLSFFYEFFILNVTAVSILIVRTNNSRQVINFTNHFLMFFP